MTAQAHRYRRRHAGRSGPAGHATAGPVEPAERKLRSQEHREERLTARRSRQKQLVRQGVAQTLAEGRALTHAAVAERTGLPVGLLCWAYPTVEALAAERS